MDDSIGFRAGNRTKYTSKEGCNDGERVFVNGDLKMDIYSMNLYLSIFESISNYLSFHS